MMITQSFLYNAIFFTYALVLAEVLRISTGGRVLLLPVRHRQPARAPAPRATVRHHRSAQDDLRAPTWSPASCSLCRRCCSRPGTLNATTHTIFWCVSFFFASAGASSAYLTVSEIFPLEVRGQAISYFFAIGQIFGSVAPILYGAMIGDGTSRSPGRRLLPRGCGHGRGRNHCPDIRGQRGTAVA